MNRLYISALAVAALSVATSCSDDFFDTSSKTTLDSQVAYGSPEAAEQSLIGCYDGWQKTLGAQGVGMYLTSTLASDECLGGCGTGDNFDYNAIDQFDKNVSPTAFSLWETDWKNYYAAIFRCNQLIANVTTADWASADEANHARILGEARGLRALLYFDIVRLFGDVPLLLEPTSANLPRTAAKEVFGAIFEDFKFAALNIPGSIYNGSTTNETDGRMSKYAAEALLARAYLFYTGYYGEEHEACTKAEAIAAIDDVVDNGQFDLEANFADLWFAACSKDASEGSTYKWETTYVGKYYNADGWHGGQNGISKEFVLNLKTNSTADYNGNSDGNVFQVFLGIRNLKIPPYSSGWGICPVNPKFVSTFDNPRMKHSVVNYKEVGLESVSGFKEKCLLDTREYTGYAVKKYAPLCFNDETDQQNAFQLGEMHKNITYWTDYTIVRFADVLLMQSELKQEATGLNRVQIRAGKGATAYSEEALRNERAEELAFEGIRYWDLLRYGKGGSYAAQKIAEMQNGVAIKAGGVDGTAKFNATSFEAAKGLVQIPGNQITLSGNVLTQNPCWE